MGFFFRSENSKIMKISPFSVGETSVALGPDSSTSALRAKAKHTGDRSCRTWENGIGYSTAAGRPGEPVAVLLHLQWPPDPARDLSIEKGGSELATQGNSAVFLC